MRRVLGWTATAAGMAGMVAPALALDPVTVLPPKKPAQFARLLDVETTGSTVPAAGGPLILAQAGGAKPAALSEAAIVERANAALNGIRTFSADFQQVGGDGRRLGGTVYVQRPGKLRFEYDKPSSLEIVSDGSTVLIRDRKLQTNDPYPISQTPLKFLTSSRIDLGGEATVKGAAMENDGARVTIEDSTTLGGTSRITLYFDTDFKQLRRWRVVDPQGYTTTVTLADIELNRTIDPKVFMLNYSRPQE